MVIQSTDSPYSCTQVAKLFACAYLDAESPYPTMRSRGNTQGIHDFLSLSEASFEGVRIRFIVCMHIQYVLPSHPDPFCGHGNVLEGKCPDARGCLQSEFLGATILEDSFVEVSDDCSHQKKHRVLRHEGSRESVSAESVVHAASGVEVVRFPWFGSVCDVFACEFLYRTRYCVCAACAKPWMQ